MSLRSKRFTNTVALLVALRGGAPPRAATGVGEEGHRGRREREKDDSAAFHPSGPSRRQPGPCTPSPPCPLRVHNWEVGVTLLLMIRLQPSWVGPRTARGHALGEVPRSPRVWGHSPGVRGTYSR